MDEPSDKERKRELYWKDRMDRAKDGHEVTRVYIEYRLEGVFEWLSDFDKRVAAEMRDHARKTQGLIVGLAVLMVVLHYLR